MESSEIMISEKKNYEYKTESPLLIIIRPYHSAVECRQKQG